MRASVILILALVSVVAPFSDLKNNYDHFSSLDEDEKYFMYWTVDEAAQIINISLAVKTTGWVGFGISPYTGRMPGSDVVIGWVDKDVAFLQDRFATAHVLPTMDKQQDYTLISGEETNGMTILKFKRKLKTGDDKDLPVEGGTTRVIWAYHELDPTSSEAIPRHQKQGTRSLNLLNAVPEINKPPLPSDTKHFDVLTGNATLPKQKTVYWCSAHRVPIESEGSHIIKISPLIEAGHEGLVHHILMYDCIFDEKYHGFSHSCYSRNMPRGLKVCRGATVMGAWAVGAGDITLPAHVGMPIGENGTRYILMETHYDNPKLESGLKDNSGLRFYYTFQKRMYDAGILEVGRVVSPFVLIPERQKRWEVVGYCSEDCTNKNLPPNGINVFASILHTHLSGVALSVKHFRNKQELPALADNPHYDFNYQELLYTKKDIKVLPKDQLTLICTYNTEKRNTVTVNGIGTYDEMCLAFLFYYPKQDLAVCMNYGHYETYVSYFNSLRAVGRTPPYNDYPSKQPYVWHVLQNATVGQGKYLQTLKNLENSAPPIQYCTAKNNKLLLPTNQIKDFVRVLANTDSTSGAGTVMHSNIFAILLAMITYYLISRS